MSSTNAEVTIDGQRATITISTETGVNVMSTGAAKRLEDAIDTVAKSDTVRFTVIRAEGKVFVAGADIKEMANYTREQAAEFGELGARVFNKIEALPSVTIAAINGAALGGGFELVLACDFRIAVERAKLGLPETSLGLLPGWGGIQRTINRAGEQAAKRLIFSANAISATDAKSINLVDEVVPDINALDDAVKTFCNTLIKGSPAAINLVKRAIRDGDAVSAFADCFTNSESKEGMNAFIEKRPATWTQGNP